MKKNTLCYYNGESHFTILKDIFLIKEIVKDNKKYIYFLQQNHTARPEDLQCIELDENCIFNIDDEQEMQFYKEKEE